MLGLTLVCVPASYATNGYFSHGYGIKSRALGGAGVAFPQDAMAAAVNPAGMAFVGNTITGGLAIFSPPRNYEATESSLEGAGAFTLTEGREKSTDDFFPIPSFGINHQLNENNTIGLTLYGNGGFNSSYRGSSSRFDPDGQGGPDPVETFAGTFGAGNTGVHLVQAFANLSFSHKFNENLAVGISPILAVQTLRATGIDALSQVTESSARNLSNSGVATPADHLSGNGDDYSFGGGIQIGIQANEVLPGLNFGTSYRSRIYMSRFDQYSDLFAENGDFDVPETLWAGLAFSASETLTLLFDFQRIWYGNIDALSNDFDHIFDCPSLGGNDFESCFGGNNGAGFGWKNINVYKFGAQWQALSSLTLRAGYSHTDQPVRSSQVLANILTPGIAEDQITAGFSYALNRRSNVDFILHYSPYNSVSGQNSLDPTQQIKIELEIFEIGLGFSYRY